MFTPVQTQIQHADVIDVTFPGYAGDPIKGWLLSLKDDIEGAERNYRSSDIGMVRERAPSLRR